MSESVLQPAYVDSAGKKIFVLLRAAAEARRCVLFVPPFAEEMNKCRRQFTETAQVLLRRGLAVLTVDLFGTGDSEGEFCEASWRQWKSDVESAACWAEAEYDLMVDSVVACRIGCALAAESFRDFQRATASTIFWQPVVEGRRFMTQFLRLRVAASIMEDDNKDTVADLRLRLAEGQSVEIAGYELAPELWAAVESSDLCRLVDARLGRLSMFEVSGPSGTAISRAGQNFIETVAVQGVEVSGYRVAGEPFWSTTEVVVNSELACRTSEVIAG